MAGIGRDIFKAIHEGKWLSIEYKNKSGDVTKYWIGICNINIYKKILEVDGFHIGNFQQKRFYIFFESIISAKIIEGTYHKINYELIEKIKLYPANYSFIFNNTANLKILNYLAECNKLDSIPYKSNFHLIDNIDNQILYNSVYDLNDNQFKQIVKNFQRKSTDNKKYKSINRICMNLLSIETPKGLYLLAYKELVLDVKNKCLKPSEQITICREFSINGEALSIRQFIDAEDYFLLDDFENNIEQIKNIITYSGRYKKNCFVNDLPYIVSLECSVNVDLEYEYNSILNMYDEQSVTTPIKAFFGDLISPHKNKKNYPITLLNKEINLDQLLSIHYAMKYPLAYIQGPPGTGKTKTIINTIITAFFNEKTVLFSSYNNHPIESVFNVLTNISYKNKIIPFPVLRIGNNDVMLKSLENIKKLYTYTKETKIFENTLDKSKEAKKEKTQKLTDLLKNYERIIDLNDRKEAIKDLLQLNNNLNFQINLNTYQLNEVNKELKQIGNITDEDAKVLLTDDEQTFLSYLYYMSAKYIKRLSEPKYEKLKKIIFSTNQEEKVKDFNRYISDTENFEKLMRVFPIITTTCISAHKIGEPKPYFDMTIIDEASQCNIAMSLLPIIRGKKLMLVGDPQQLNPVIVLDNNSNNILKKRYNISDDYDYIKNSIYKTFLACDSISNEILLSHHYRCNKKIIEFNNAKYYNNKLKIESKSKNVRPLIFTDIKNNTTNLKNTAPAEVDKIIQYAKNHSDKTIGIITPFTNQKNCIETALKEENLNNITCGTVHAFQGDEKDVILFSLSLTDKTHPKTYNWLKNNKELINVAVSRAKEQLIILSSTNELRRLHTANEKDDIYELVNYVRTNGVSEVTPKDVSSRALGIKPYSTETESAFLETLNHALSNILLTEGKYSVEREVAISQVFKNNITYNDLFYTGRFDFVIYVRDYNKQKIPLLAIELDGKEHIENEIVKERDKKKNEICKKHNFSLIRVENSYARRYNFIKDVLLDYFGKSRKK